MQKGQRIKERQDTALVTVDEWLTMAYRAGYEAGKETTTERIHAVIDRLKDFLR